MWFLNRRYQQDTCERHKSRPHKPGPGPKPHRRMMFIEFGRRSVTLSFVFCIMVVATINIIEGIQRRLYGVEEGVTLEGRDVSHLFEDEARRKIEELASTIVREPLDASIDKFSGEIVSERPGVYVDIDETLANLMRARPGSDVSLKRVEVEPRFTADDLRVLDTELGGYTTFLQGNPWRTNNIRLPTQALNNSLIMPGEVLSFNGTVGERTPEKGYKPAPIIVGESVVPGTGGGVCQVSTTLYNAVRRAGLEVVERHMHSMRVSYIERGKDATVAWPYSDFKFRNNTDFPVILKGYVGGGRVRIWIMGRNPSRS